MLKKLIFFVILLPIAIIVSLTLSAFLLSKTTYYNEYNLLIILIVYISITVFAKRKGLFKLKLPDFKISIKQLVLSFFVALVLFLLFYLERVYFNNYEKSYIPILISIYVILLAPIVEEIFIKKIIIDNLIFLKIYTGVIISISGIYFSLLHFPNIYVIHFIIGLLTSSFYIKNRNLTQVILIHVFYNLFIILYNFL